MAIRNQCHIEEVVQTHQEEGFPQDRANRIHAAAMGDLKSLMNQMWQKQAHEMEAVCSQFQEEKNGTITRLETEVKDLQQCLRESETTVTSLRREKQEKTAEIEGLKVVQANLKADEGRLRADVKNLRRLLRQRETSLSSLRKENQEKTAEIDELKVVQDNLKAEEGRLNTVVCKMRKANKDLNDELQEKVRTERREKEFQSQKNAFLASRHDAEIQKLREEKMTELEIAAGENQELKQTLAEQRIMQGELKVKVQEHSASISDLMRERESLQDQIRNLEDTVKRRTQKTATLEEDLMQVLQQFQGVGRHVLGVHAQLMQDLMPRAPDVVRVVSAEGNTVGVDSLQDVSGAWTKTFHSASLPSMSLPGALQVPVENLPDVSTLHQTQQFTSV